MKLRSIISQKLLTLPIWDLDQSISESRFTLRTPSKHKNSEKNSRFWRCLVLSLSLYLTFISCITLSNGKNYSTFVDWTNHIYVITCVTSKVKLLWAAGIFLIMLMLMLYLHKIIHSKYYICHTFKISQLNKYDKIIITLLNVI